MASGDEIMNENTSSEAETSFKNPVIGIVSDEEIPQQLQPERFNFSWRNLMRFMGPGLLVSIAYLDPGNIESDLRAGTFVQYKLLWALWWSTLIGLFVQTMVSRLGVVTGKNMAELCHILYPRTPRFLIWLMMEIAIIGSDIQEVIGSSIAIYLLSNGKVPIWSGVLVTLCDTFTFMIFEKSGLRTLEVLFAILIGIMAVTFGYEYIISSPNTLAVLKGIIIPWCGGCDPRIAIIQGVGILGASIMPHNLYLHSSLVTSRKLDERDGKALSEANFYYLIETTLALCASFIINLFVVGVFAAGLHGKTNSFVFNLCKESKVKQTVFPDNSELIDANLYKGGVYLHCAFGSIAVYIWAIGLLAAGQSSTMTCTFSGQFIMESFLQLKWAPWKRTLFTRSFAVVPTVCVAFYHSIDELTQLNDLMNVFMSLQLPFAMIPAITITNSPVFMGNFRNGKWNQLLLLCTSTSIIFLNTYFLIVYIGEKIPEHAVLGLIMGVLTLLYIALVLYLLLFQLAFDDFPVFKNLLKVPDKSSIVVRLQQSRASQENQEDN